MENKFQIRRVRQGHYKGNVDTFKEKIKCIMSEIDQKLGKHIKTSEITAGNDNLKTYTKRN